MRRFKSPSFVHIRYCRARRVKHVGNTRTTERCARNVDRVKREVVKSRAAAVYQFKTTCYQTSGIEFIVGKTNLPTNKLHVICCCRAVDWFNCCPSRSLTEARGVNKPSAGSCRTTLTNALDMHLEQPHKLCCGLFWCTRASTQQDQTRDCQHGF